MTFKPELLRKIREHFDLNIYETKVWAALLSKGIATAGEIAELSEVPRSRTYDVLESLEKKGFAIAKIGKPVRFLAVKPTVVVDKLKSDLIKEAEEKTDILAVLKDSDDYKQIELLYKQGITPIKAEDLSGTIKGRANIYAHLREMVSKATKNVSLITNTDVLKKKMKILQPLLQNLGKKNVKIRIAASGSEEEIKQAAKDTKLDIMPTNISARFCIVDNNELLFMLNQNSQVNEDMAIWISSPYFAGALGNLFELSCRK